MNRILLEAGMMAGAFLILALPVLRSRGLGWIVAMAAVGFLAEGAAFLPIVWPRFDFLGGKWNWTGELFEIISMLAVALLLILFVKFRRTDFGLTFAQTLGTGRAVLFCIVPFLVLDGILVWFMAPHGNPTLETLGFQATMPGLDEELFYRGVMLALFDRMFLARVNILGVRLGYGAIVVTLVFALDHAVGVDKNLVFHFSPINGLFPAIVGLFLVWIRGRTQSLVWPVLTHNALNLLNNVLPAFV